MFPLKICYTIIFSVIILNFSLNINFVDGLILSSKGSGWISCSIIREVDNAEIAFSAVGNVSQKGIDGSYWIGETKFNSTGGIVNISSINKTTLSYTLVYEGEVNQNNCPVSDPNQINPKIIKFIATIKGSCGDNSTAIFDSKVLNGKFITDVNCFE